MLHRNSSYIKYALFGIWKCHSEKKVYFGKCRRAEAIHLWYPWSCDLITLLDLLTFLTHFANFKSIGILLKINLDCFTFSESVFEALLLFCFWRWCCIFANYTTDMFKVDKWIAMQMMLLASHDLPSWHSHATAILNFMHTKVPNENSTNKLSTHQTI